MGTFLLLFILVGTVYGIYIGWDDIKEGYSGMGFWGWLICLALVGHILGGIVL